MRNIKKRYIVALLLFSLSIIVLGGKKGMYVTFASVEQFGSRTESETTEEIEKELTTEIIEKTEVPEETKVTESSETTEVSDVTEVADTTEVIDTTEVTENTEATDTTEAIETTESTEISEETLELGIMSIALDGEAEDDPNAVLIAEASDELDYQVDIVIPDMKFVYDYGGYWNTKTHRYESGKESGQTEPGWATKYLENNRNRIIFRNIGKKDLDVSFEFYINDTFNDYLNDEKSVVGIFSADNDVLIDCAGNPDIGFEYARDNGMLSYSCVVRADTNERVFFALCGTPDDEKRGRGDRVIGTISIKAVPHEENTTE